MRVFYCSPAGICMEINPFLLKIKDFTERTDTLRGYL